jgi:hypothetical protein
MRKLTSLLLAVVMLLAGVALADFDAAANTFPIADEKIPLTVTIYGARTEIEDWETNFVCNYWEENWVWTSLGSLSPLLQRTKRSWRTSQATIYLT